MKAAAIALLAVLPVAAEVPSKRQIDDYRELWTQSPFTSAGVRAAAPAPLDDPSGTIASQWALRGVSELSGGLRVTLVNRSSPDKIQEIREGKPSAFSLVKVERGNGSLEDLAVTVSDGQRTETLRFDKETLAPAVAVAPAKALDPKPPRAVIVSGPETP